MSTNRPNPVALTAAMLMANHSVWLADNIPDEAANIGRDAPTVANLASSIHRLAPACARLAEAECNGEWWDGQREKQVYLEAAWPLPGQLSRVEVMERSITDYATRLDKRIAKLNAQLAPFGYQLIRSGDPRGATLSLAETPVSVFTTHYAIG